MFGFVVSGIDILIFEKGKEIVPVGKGSLCPGADQGIFTVQKNLTVIADSFLDRQSFLPQLLSGAPGSFKGMPDGENGAGLLSMFLAKQ